jgi:predicted SprT family Zn-dependent metalloprotease
MSDALRFVDARRILEASFAPLRCSCEKKSDGAVSVKVYNSNCTKCQLDNIRAERFSTVRGVTQLTLEIKEILSRDKG